MDHDAFIFNMAEKFTITFVRNAIYTHDDGFTFGECDMLTVRGSPLNKQNNG
jgi:hypothetical protein